MSDAPNPFAAMLAQMQEQMQDMAKAMPQAGAFDPAKGFDAKGFEALWPTMPKEVMEAWFGNAANPEGLDAKTRLLLTLAGLTMQGGQAETPLRQTVRHALAAGATHQQITETIGLMVVFAGTQATTKAMELASEVLSEEGDT